MSDKRKFVIFDLDGTLIDSYECVLRCVNKTLDFFNLSPIELIKQSAKHRNIAELFDKVSEILNNQIPYESFKSVFDYVHYNDSFEKIQINYSVYEELLRYAQSDYKILILTNKFEKTAYKIIRKIFPNLNIDVIGRIGIYSLKSNIELVKKLLNQHEFIPYDCLCYYGDSSEDERLSHELGITYIKIL